MLDRAPLDLRVNRLKGARERAAALLPEAVTDAHVAARPAPARGFRVEETEAWRAGLVEIQDEGSQLICLGCEAAPGLLAVDLCAGAGGKTLALAAEMAEGGADPRLRHRSRPAFADGAAARARRASRSSSRACSIRGERPRRWPMWPARPISSWSTRPARGPAPGGAIRRRAGGSRRSGSNG